MGNTINNLRGQPNLERETSSIHSENNNVTSSSGLPHPTFLPRRANLRDEEGIEQPLTSTEDIAREYTALEPHIREADSFREFCANKRREMARGYVNEELKHEVSKVAIPTFNGSGEMSAHQRLQKLNTFFLLNPMTEVAYDWWTHGRISLGHKDVKSSEEFSQKLMNRFDEKDTEWYLQELTHLKQTRTLNEYVKQFQEISFMIPNLSQKRLTHVYRS